jgi:hypothetical protein
MRSMTTLQFHHQIHPKVSEFLSFNNFNKTLLLIFMRHPLEPFGF